MRVELRGVTRRFGELRALDAVGFSLPAGARAALVGPNGSGKSTLIRALVGLLRVEGEIRVDGHAPGLETLRDTAYVPQSAPQLAAPVAELVGAVARLRGIAPEAVEKLAAHLELDLAALGARPFRSLSGGMKQKLLLALAFAARPRLLVLDEPTGSLDARSRERLFPLFEALPATTTVILCSHRLEEIRQLVAHVLLLEEGRLLHDGPAVAFLAATTTALVDVRTLDPQAERWLAEHGFRRGAAGWWLRAVDARSKLALLPELSAALGTALLDLNVRDLETVDLEAARRGPA